VAEDVAFSGPSEISLGSTWVSNSCSVTVEGSFGPGLVGNGAWIDYSQEGSGVVVNGGGGAFSFDLTTSPPANPRGPYFGLSDPCHALLPTYPYNLNISFAAECVGLCSGVDCSDGNPLVQSIARQVLDVLAFFVDLVGQVPAAHPEVHRVAVLGDDVRYHRTEAAAAQYRNLFD
jgi:hypothetical protein